MLGFEVGEPCHSRISISGLANIRNMISLGSGQLLFTFANMSGWDNEEIYSRNGTPVFKMTQGQLGLLVSTFFLIFFFSF